MFDCGFFIFNIVYCHYATININIIITKNKYLSYNQHVCTCIFRRIDLHLCKLLFIFVEEE